MLDILRVNLCPTYVSKRTGGGRVYKMASFADIQYCIYADIMGQTIRKRKKMAGQNTFQILLLNDANMIEEH